MNWLQDIEDKQRAERRRLEGESELWIRRYRTEVKRLSPMVERLLTDLGNRWLGRPFIPWKRRFRVVTDCRPGCVHWHLQVVGYVLYFGSGVTVKLEGIVESKPRFQIVGADLYQNTQDTSEAGLIDALRAVAAKLPLRNSH